MKAMKAMKVMKAKSVEGFAEEWDCSGAGDGHWPQEVRVLEGSRRPRGDWHCRGEEGQVHDPRALHDQDEDEARHEGRHAADVRQECEGGSKACKDHCEGLLRQGAQG